MIEQFGKEQFESLLTINFEESKEPRKTFDGDLNPALILRDLPARLNTPSLYYWEREKKVQMLKYRPHRSQGR